MLIAVKKMGLFDLFRKKKVQKKRVVGRKRKSTDSKIKEAFENVKKDVDEIKGELKEHSEILEGLKPLPNKFKELQKQFSEFIVSSVNSSSTSSSVHQEVSEVNEVSEVILKGLTPHTKKALSILVSLLNEYGDEWLPVSELTRELYPSKEARKIRNAVSNTIKPLINNKLIERKREGNYVFIKLTKKGLKVCQEELSKVQLKKIAKYHKK